MSKHGRGARGPIRATDLVAKLQTDPQYLQRVEKLEAERARRDEALWRAERPIVQELRAAGVDVDSVWDLVNTSDPYPKALPILLRHLEKGGYPDWLMAGLARAMAVRPAVSWWERLRELYLRARGQAEEDGLAAALAAAATRDQEDALIELLLSDSKGSSRIHFLRPVLRLGGRNARALVEGLRNDPVLGREVAVLLSNPS